MTKATQLHATCVSIGGKGVLLLGKPGSGKSDLAMRLIDGGAQLVSDDRVDITASGKALTATAPAKLRGLIEARGIGILTLPYRQQVRLALAIDLTAAKAVERLPEKQVWRCLGKELPLHSLNAFEVSAAAKIRLLLKQGVK